LVFLLVRAFGLPPMGFAFGPVNPVQMAIKATKSRAAGRSHSGAWRLASVVALASAVNRASSAFSSRRWASSLACLASLQVAPQIFLASAFRASACALAASCLA
jgi:hypothetical protein